MSETTTNQRFPEVIRKILVIVGGIAIAVAFLADLIGLSSPESIGNGQILMAVVGIVFVVIGALGPWLGSIYRATAIIVLNTLILVALLEFGIRVYHQVSGWGNVRQQQTQAFIFPDYYSQQDWEEQYRAEWLAFENPGNGIRFSPYVGWRAAPFESETINVNQARIRVTPMADCGADSYTVFTFGGSTMWGVGSPDWLTIPAFLQVSLQELRDEPVCVMNFGQLGYQSTQGLITLLMELQDGNIPDSIIFYDGGNDIQMSYEAGQAKAYMGLNISAARFDQTPLVNMLSDTLLFQSMQNLTSIASREPLGLVNQMRPEENDTDDLANDIIQTFLSNYNLVRTLAQEYDFEFYFFWQPMIGLGQKPLSEEELILQDRVYNSPGLANLYETVYGAIEQIASEYDHLYYIVDIFDQEATQLYMDHIHITPVGNQIVADEMLRIITS